MSEENKNKKKSPKKRLVKIESAVSKIPYERLISPLDTFIKAARRFLTDGSMIRANAIAYALVLSIIPILTVIVRFAAIDNEEIHSQISRLLSVYGIHETAAIIEVLDSILSRANTIAGIGLVFMIYSATNLLKHLEDTANFIFKAPERPYFFRITIFVASLVLIPAVVVLYSGLIRPTLSLLKPEAYTAFSTEAPIALKSDGFIRMSDNTEFSIQDRIDFFATRRIWVISNQDGLIVDPGSDQVALPVDSRPEKKTLRNLKYFSSSGNLFAAITEDGLLIYSLNSGTTWDFRSIWTTDGISVRKPIVEDLVVFPDRIIFLLTGRSTTYMISWNPHSNGVFEPVYHNLAGIYKSLSIVPTGYKNENDMREIIDLSLVIGGNAGYRISYDRGFSITRHQKLGNQQDTNDYVERLCKTFDGKLAILTQSGTLRIQLPDAPSDVFPSLRVNKKPVILDMYISPEGTGIMYGERGFLRFTQDGGLTWHKTSIDFKDTDIYSHYAGENGDYRFAGSEEFLANYRFDSIDYSKDHGHGIAVFKKTYSDRANPWLGLFYNLLFIGNIYVLFFAILAFTYRSLPNTDVSWNAATSGAIVSSLGLSIFAWIFRTTVASFSNAGYIYGVWVAIPLGMLILLATVQIVLFGFQITAIVDQKRKRASKKLSSNRADDETI